MEQGDGWAQVDLLARPAAVLPGGRPRRELDLRAARVLLAQDHSVRQVADRLGLPRATLQRRLREAGIPTGPGGPEPQGAEAA